MTQASFLITGVRLLGVFLPLPFFSGGLERGGGEFTEAHTSLESTSWWHFIQPPVPTPADMSTRPARRTSISQELRSDTSAS